MMNRIPVCAKHVCVCKRHEHWFIALLYNAFAVPRDTSILKRPYLSYFCPIKSVELFVHKDLSLKL